MSVFFVVENINYEWGSILEFMYNRLVGLIVQSFGLSIYNDKRFTEMSLKLVQYYVIVEFDIIL